MLERRVRPIGQLANGRGARRFARYLLITANESKSLTTISLAVEATNHEYKVWSVQMLTAVPLAESNAQPTIEEQARAGWAAEDTHMIYRRQFFWCFLVSIRMACVFLRPEDIA